MKTFSRRVDNKIAFSRRVDNEIYVDNTASGVPLKKEGAGRFAATTQPAVCHLRERVQGGLFGVRSVWGVWAACLALSPAGGSSKSSYHRSSLSHREKEYERELSMGDGRRILQERGCRDAADGTPSCSLEKVHAADGMFNLCCNVRHLK